MKTAKGLVVRRVTQQSTHTMALGTTIAERPNPQDMEEIDAHQFLR